MDIVVLVCSIIAAITGVASLKVAILNRKDGKRNLLKQINKRKQRIREIDYELFKTFGPDYSCQGPINPLESEKRNLQSEIDYLKTLL